MNDVSYPWPGRHPVLVGLTAFVMSLGYRVWLLGRFMQDGGGARNRFDPQIDVLQQNHDPGTDRCGQDAEERQRPCECVSTGPGMVDLSGMR